MTLKQLKKCLLAAWLGAVASGGVALANPVIIPDFSFENTILADGVNTGAPDVGTNWLAAGNGGVFLGNPFDTNFVASTGAPGTLPAPADGTNCLFMGLGRPGYAWQDLGPISSNTIYTLTVAVGRTLTASAGQGQIALVNGKNAFGPILAATQIDTGIINAGEFQDVVLVFTTGQQSSGHLTILLNGYEVDSTAQIAFDNVRLDATATPLTPTALLPTASPSNTVFIGTLVTLSENAAGSPGFTYQWQTDNGTSGAAFSSIPKATNATYVVDTTSFASGFQVQYQVIVANSLGRSTSAPVVVTASDGAPIVVQDTLPATAADVVGSQITFTAVMDGTRPISYQWQVDTGFGPVNIPGATNANLTLSNLQLTDNGIYNVLASNVFSVTASTGSTLVVNDTPTATNNIVASPAAQTGLGGPTFFHPTWTVAPNSLIAGTAPSAVGPGSFNFGASGTPAVLTDGSTGLLFPAGNGSIDEITGGTPGSGAGQFVTYTLPASATGWDLTNLVVYGGWSDAGRDQQRYAVYYSTTASPTNFNLLANVNYNPVNPLAAQSATRITLTSATSDPMAKNVAAVKFDFTPLDQAVENGFAGYSEMQIYGVHSAPAPVVSANTLPVTGSDVEGGSVTFTAAFSSTTPVTYQWRVDKGSGPVAIPGATNTTLTLSNLQLSDTASPGYSLQAINSSGSASSSFSAFTVKPAPTPDANGMLVAQANQTGSGSTFTPTWTISTNSLIYGAAPTGIGSGSFRLENAGGIPILTDGKYGFVGSGNNTTMATAGNSGSAGHSLTYTLTGSASGYDLANIVTYGGWSDGGRDQQAYTVSYSTVANPTVFTPITSVSYNPTLPGSVPTTDRVTVSAPSGPIAVNVAQVKFDFTTPGTENGYAGYAELSLAGTPSAPIALAPVVSQDTMPVTAMDVVGSQVIFTSVITGDQPMSYQWMKDTGAGPTPIAGATGPTLTLSNLQLTDSATPGYSLVASNALGIVATSARSLTVNPVPNAVANIITTIATQTGLGVDKFSPTWQVAGGSLIAGFAPSAVGSGNFSADHDSGTVAVLTDGKFGPIYPPGSGSPSMVTCGTGAGGQTVTYALTNSATGYNLSSVVVYGGWSDAGRDQQHYTVSVATAANPSVYVNVASVNYNPTLPGTVQSAVRSTLYPASSGPLATNVVSVRVNFTTPTGENGYSGYAEVQVFGAVAPPLTPPTIASTTLSGGNLVMVGGGGTAGGTYSLLTSTNVAAPVSTWTTNSTGVFASNGGYTNTIPVTQSQPARFFRIKTP